MDDYLPPKQELQPVLPPVPVQDSGVEIYPQFAHLELSIEAYLKTTHNLKLDTDAQICADHLSSSGCSLGTKCPKRHTTPSSRNFRPPSPIPFSAHARTVCKHWLRGLCKKGQACEFLHEYNLRKMPECWFFTRYGFCQSGDECMYLHITPKERRPECMAFVKGFCPKGPDCPYKHIRRYPCPLYLTGFCPRGYDCQLAHPPFDLTEVQRLVSPELAQERKEKEQGLYSNRDRDWPEESGGRGTGAFGSGAPGAPGADGRRPRRDLSEVLCFKCGQKGHYASQCPNPSVPGVRGGVERGPGGRVYGE